MKLRDAIQETVELLRKHPRAALEWQIHLNPEVVIGWDVGWHEWPVWRTQEFRLKLAGLKEDIAQNFDVVEGALLWECLRTDSRRQMFVDVLRGLALRKECRARLRWLRPEEGGRPAPPGIGLYSTMARFEGDPMGDAWSIRCQIEDAADSEGVMGVGLHFLVRCRDALLAPGSRFTLFEGDRRVADGEVL
jgi:hypothetical protein